MEHKKSIICVVGKPGSGKTKICENVSLDFPVSTINIDEAINNEINNNTNLGKELEEYKNNNSEIPNDLLVEVIKQNIENAEKENDKQGIVVDGFPESLGHTLELENALNNTINLINLNISDEKGKENYINDIANSSNPNAVEEFKEKMENFNTKVVPVIDYYEEKNPEFYNKVDANKPFNSLYNDVKEIIPEILSKSRRNSGKTTDLRSDLPEKLENNNANNNNGTNVNSNKENKNKLLNDNSNIIFVLGGPGSGKGTQCDKIVDEFGLKHLSTGDMLREEVNKGTELGKELNEIMKEGKMVPQDLVLKLVKQEIDDNKNAKGFLIDGFPRTLDQAKSFEENVGPVKSVLYFDCPPEVLEERLLERGKTSGRADDNIDTIKKRLETYENMKNNSAVNSIKDSNEKDGNNDPILDDTLTNEINTKVDTTESNENIRSENPIFHDKDMMDSDENLGPETIKNKKRYKIVFALEKQSKKLSELFEYELICTGDVLRKEVEDKGPYADIISNHITVGELVPDDIVNEVIMKTISNDLSHYKFLIEGYPRTVKQAEYFEKNISPFKFILYFKCSETLLTTRFHHQMSESQINIGEDIIEKRMEEYTNNTQKTIDYFTSQNRVKEVSLERTEEEIANRAKEIFVEYDNSGSYEEYHKK
ncbi:ADK-domain-containing protein [Neocallimastix californiae]|uniref:ADK-domain-containing protein n=1 Tax=Neocallimastix californiae TaxID=1754190 RepID=A0A1Y2BU51_9FUNG|nr:ADK-domain-containing protein [Neocallimastix californiae]|eukprot:ORY38281.1 ADK-domain-containing protein [Neocallimastix californiae]